ncbi:MAG: response regulator [Myxococcales bacterium]|jgi:DNA-binding response OmpR family regulator|nr:MAG: response regulator [Myxococcales bacterium]
MTKILVVDDEAGYRTRIKELLADEGYTVETAGTGQNAIDVAREFHPDLLVVDWMLKDELDGFDVAHALRRESPDLETILITGYPTPALEAKAIDSHVCAVVYKPFEPDELSAAVRRSLKN